MYEQCRSQRLSGQWSTDDSTESSWSAPLRHNAPDESHQWVEVTRQSSGGSHFGHNFSQIPVHSALPEPIQTKLIISQPGDGYEQEANQVAEQLMRITDLGPSQLDEED